MIDSNDNNSSPYDDVNKFLVFVPSARILGSLSSGLRLVIKFISDDHMLVDLGVKIGALMIVRSDFRSFVMTQGT